MIPQEDRDETPGAPRKSPPVGATRAPLHLVFQAFIGVMIGIGIAKMLAGVAPARLAFVGVVVAIAVWVVEQVFALPAPNTKPGVQLRLCLRMVSLVGFTLALSPLLTLLGA